MEDQPAYGTSVLTPKEKRKAIAALERIKTRSRETGELTFMFISFHEGKMIYTESNKMPTNSS